MIQAEQVKSSFFAVWRSIPYSIPPFHSIPHSTFYSLPKKCQIARWEKFGTKSVVSDTKYMGSFYISSLCVHAINENYY